MPLGLGGQSNWPPIFYLVERNFYNRGFTLINLQMVLEKTYPQNNYTIKTEIWSNSISCKALKVFGVIEGKNREFFGVFDFEKVLIIFESFQTILITQIYPPPYASDTFSKINSTDYFLRLY